MPRESFSGKAGVQQGLWPRSRSYSPEPGSPQCRTVPTSVILAAEQARRDLSFSVIKLPASISCAQALPVGQHCHGLCSPCSRDGSPGSALAFNPCLGLLTSVIGRISQNDPRVECHVEDSATAKFPSTATQDTAPSGSAGDTRSAHPTLLS